MVKQAALPDELCPKCGAANHGRATFIWHTSEAPGRMECDACGAVWRHPNTKPGRGVTFRSGSV